MAYSQDVLTRIVNVQWGGVKFVYGTLTDNALYYVGVTGGVGSLDQQTIEVPGPGDPQFGLSAFGSSYNSIIKNAGQPDERRIPTFLVCGNRVQKVTVDDGAGNEIDLLQYFTMVYYSTDGLNWTIVLQYDGGTPSLSEPSTASNPVALVWDQADTAFFYDQNVAATDRIYRSPDGKSFEQISSTSTVGAVDYKSEFLTHCVANDCLDDLGQHVPDGVMSTPGTVTAKPVKPPIIYYADGTSSVGVSSDGETWGGDEVVVSSPDDNGTIVDSTVSVTGVKKVFCVAVGGGAIMAGGAADIAGETGSVAISFDLGKTWKTIATPASPVITMVSNARL